MEKKVTAPGCKRLNYLQNSKTHSDFVSSNSKRLLLTFYVKNYRLEIDSKYSDFYTLKLNKKSFNEDKFRTTMKEQEATFSVRASNLIRNKWVNNGKA